MIAGTKDSGRSLKRKTASSTIGLSSVSSTLPLKKRGLNGNFYFLHVQCQEKLLSVNNFLFAFIFLIFSVTDVEGFGGQVRSAELNPGEFVS